MAKTRKVRLKRRSQQTEQVTKKGIALFVGLLVLAVVGFIVGIRMGVARKDANLSSSSNLTEKGLYYQLKMGKTSYTLGEPIGIELSVTNVTANPIVLNFQKNLEFDLIVRKEVDLLFAQVPKTVWMLSDKKSVYQDQHVVRLDAGKTLTFEGVWDQTDRDSNSVQPGRYQIIGSLLADDRSSALQIRGQMNE